MARVNASFGLGLFCAVTLLSANAGAQEVVTGSFVHKNGPVTLPHDGTVTGAEARDVEDQFAACVVNRHYAAARHALALTPNSAAQFDALHKILDDSCWTMAGPGGSWTTNVEMITRPAAFRASIYKALVRKDWARSSLTLAPTTPGDLAHHSGMVVFADCLVRLNPEGSRAMVVAQAGSKSEADALGALRPTLSRCLKAGDQVALTKPALSAALAEAYYTEALASRIASSK